MTRNVLPRALVVSVLVAAVLGLSSCQQEASNETGPGHVYGNGFKDQSPVICRVGDREITQNDLDMRYKELPKKLQKEFTGKNWERRFLHFMADEVLLYDAARELQLDLEPLVQQQIISMYRQTMVDAYKVLQLYRDLQPNETEINEYYQQFMHNYVAEGAIHLRHIECMDRESAEKAYEALQGTGRESQFPYVVAKYSRNVQTAADGGDLGWVNEGGFVRYVKDGKLLSQTVWGWELGVHEPIQIGDRWHVVDLAERRNPRQMSVSEVRGQIINDIMPSLQQAVLEERLSEIRAGADVEYLGDFAPGNGRSAEELFQHGLMANTPEKQIDIFDLIIEDFPGTDYAAKSLFMQANVQLDNWGDTRRARYYLRKLVNEYPDSELREQADFMLANMAKMSFKAPKSIEELQKLTK
jgi:tetratricopeptide (TPR) repeat protein